MDGPLVPPWKIWKAGHEPFGGAGSDTFVPSAPGGNVLWTADKAIISQLFHLHPKVEQPINLRGFWNVWGPTIATVDGDDWKAHRKAVTAGFGPGINRIVWEESIYQATSLSEFWLKDRSAIIPSIRHDTSKLALHVISGGFFNKRLMWGNAMTTSIVDGHNVEFDTALFTFLSRLGTIFMVPRWLLAYLPGKMFKEAHLAYTEMTRYLEEMQASAASQIEKLAEKKNKSLLEAIVLSAAGPDLTSKRPLPQEAVMGNIFFTLLAGHETTGSAIGFSFIFLAVYPDLQRRVHEELDRQLRDRPSTTWSYEQDFPPLYRGWLGAVQKEVLYLYNPAQFLMRRVVEPVTIVDSQNRSYNLPAGMLTLINKAAEARNPANWQRPPKPASSTTAASQSPAAYFSAERWLDVAEPTPLKEDQEQGQPDWSAFGAGGRSCPGKAFAQAEMVGTMATVLKYHSLELVVPDDVLRACGDDADLAWQETHNKAVRMLYDGIEANIAIFLGQDLPIRIKKRP